MSGEDKDLFYKGQMGAYRYVFCLYIFGERKQDNTYFLIESFDLQDKHKKEEHYKSNYFYNINCDILSFMEKSIIKREEESKARQTENVEVSE